MAKSRLLGLTSDYAKPVRDDESGIDVLHVTSPHVLTQAAGYLKYMAARDNPSGVFFRGQARLYSTLIPSLYRSVVAQSGKQRNDEDLKQLLKSIESDGKVLRAVPAYAREALLQHYGLRTRWIDLVDNVWVALWFACHHARATGLHGEYLHFERRTPDLRGNVGREFAYVLMIEVGLKTGEESVPGTFCGGDSELIDLRVAAPSFFLRPHAQHALLFRRVKHSSHLKIDLFDHVAGVIRVSVEDALRWLGSGDLLCVHALFPPPVYDFGYRELLSFGFPPSRNLGAVHHVGA
jgi:hypothetical protein